MKKTRSKFSFTKYVPSLIVRFVELAIYSTIYGIAIFTINYYFLNLSLLKPIIIFFPSDRLLSNLQRCKQESDGA